MKPTTTRTRRSAAESGELASYRSGERARAVRIDERRGARRDRPWNGPRPAMLPMAMMLILGLLLGFAAGYVVAERARRLEEQAAASPRGSSPAPPASPQPPAIRSGAAAAFGPGVQRADRRGSLPATPPVPGDAPAADSARPARPRGAVPGTGLMIVQSDPAARRRHGERRLARTDAADAQRPDVRHRTSCASCSRDSRLRARR